MNNINRWIFEIPLSDVRDDGVDNTDVGECICCGKHLKNAKYSVHLLTNGNLVSTDQKFSEDEDQGFFSIGNECKNRLPNNFTFKI